MSFDFAGVVFDIVGSSLESEFLRDEFKNVNSSNNTIPDLTIKFVHQHESIKNGIVVGQFVISENVLRHEMSSFSYQLSRKLDIYHLEIYVKNKRKLKRYLPGKVLSLLEMSNLEYHELVGKNILYDCLDFVFQQILLLKGSSFIHASSGVIGDKTYAFLAWGGVGKSTSLLKLMREKGMKYLSDDLGIISSHGELFYNPKKMQIYAYNLENQDWLAEKMLSGRTSFDILAWKLRLKVYGKKRVRRRVSVESLFGMDSLASSSTLNNAIYLERSNGAEYCVEDMSVGVISAKAAYVLSEELKPFSLVSSAYKSTFPNGNLILSHEQLFERSKEIIEKGLSNCHLMKSFKIPLNATPDDMLLNFEKDKLI